MPTWSNMHTHVKGTHIRVREAFSWLLLLPFFIAVNLIVKHILKHTGCCQPHSQTHSETHSINMCVWLQTSNTSWNTQHKHVCVAAKPHSQIHPETHASLSTRPNTTWNTIAYTRPCCQPHSRTHQTQCSIRHSSPCPYLLGSWFPPVYPWRLKKSTKNLYAILFNNFQDLSHMQPETKRVPHPFSKVPTQKQSSNAPNQATGS